MSARFFDGVACNMSFARCVAFSQLYPKRFVLGYAPDPRLPDAINRLQKAIDSCGVHVCGEVKYRMAVDDANTVRMCRFCGGFGTAGCD